MRRVYGPFALAAEGGGTARRGPVAVGVREIAVGTVDRSETVGPGRDHHPGDGKMPHVTPMAYPFPSRIGVGQDRVIGVGAADVRRPRAGRGGKVGDAEVERFVAIAGGGDGADVLHPQGGFDDQGESDPRADFPGRFDLAQQHVDGVDVRRRADLRDHDHVEARASRFHDLDHVAVHVLGVEAIDADGHRGADPIDLVEAGDDVFSGPRLVRRRDRILEVEKDDVRPRARRLLEQIGLASRHRQFASLEAWRGLFDAMKTHPGVPIPWSRTIRRLRGGEGVVVADQLLETGVEHVGVNLGRRDIGVAE